MILLGKKWQNIDWKYPFERDDNKKVEEKVEEGEEKEDNSYYNVLGTGLCSLHSSWFLNS